MSVKPNKKPSFALGLILILLLLAAVILGGSWVVRQAFLPRQSDARPAAAAVSGQPDAAAQLPVQTAEETVSGAQPEAVPEPAAEPEPEPARVTLMAVGDDLIHNCVYWSAETPEGGYDFTPFFDDIRPIVQQYDLACINQETILVQDRSLIASYPIFGSPIEVADALADAGFNVVTFAGNHCFDKKETGVTDTLRYFHETYPDITTLGIHDSEADAAVIPIVEKNGIRIAMLNFTYGLNNSMPEKRWMVDMLSSTDTVCGRIAQAKQEADFVIVFPHWGTEDELSPDESQLRWAQEMADAGAESHHRRPSAHAAADRAAHSRGRPGRSGLLQPRQLPVAPEGDDQPARRHGERHDRQGQGRHTRGGIRAEAHHQRHPPGPGVRLV